MSDDAQGGLTSRCTSVTALDQGFLHAARALAAGIISGGIVHEFANLLTIIDGQRQMAQLGLRQGGPAADIVETLAQPAQRCQQLLEAFRHLFAEFDSDLEELPLAQELLSLQLLLNARLRGRATRIEIDRASSSMILPGRGSLAARLAFLLGLLSVLEHGRAGERYPERIRLAGRGHESSCRSLIAEFTRFRPAPEEHVSRSAAERLLETATELIRRFGGRLSLSSSEDPGADSVTLQVFVLR